MKKINLILIGLTFVFFTNGQILKIQGGTSISKLDWDVPAIHNGSLYNKTLIGYSVFAGIDYLDKNFFNLSSNIGMIRKGGKSDNMTLTDSMGNELRNLTVKPTLDYLSINTTIDFKYPIKKKVFPFLSIGPRIDYLLNSSGEFSYLKQTNDLKTISFGLILGAGVKYNISKFQLGLRADYFLDFTKVADWSVTTNRVAGDISANTFSINLTVGYRIK